MSAIRVAPTEYTLGPRPNASGRKIGFDACFRRTPRRSEGEADGRTSAFTIPAEREPTSWSDRLCRQLAQLRPPAWSMVMSAFKRRTAHLNGRHGRKAARLLWAG